MGRYVDGFVIPVPKANLDAYKTMAEQAAKVWKEHGCLDYWECVGDDLNVEGMVSFRTLAGAKEDETVIFGWCVFESREHRDVCNAKIMADPRLEGMMDKAKPVFDCSRMAFGGFKVLLHG